MTRHRALACRSAAALVVLAASAGVLSACTTAGMPPTSTPTTSSSATTAATPSPSATAGDAPSLVPEGSAEDNLPLFADVVDEVWASPDRLAGRAYIDALVSAGFDKEAMEVTNDLSTVGNPAETIQFSVLWDDDCLVGQVGPATGDPHVIVLPVVDGRCLVGDTRPIDW